MDNTSTVSADYKKGFNQAYRLGETMPEVLKGIDAPSNSNNDYTLGFTDAKKQFEKDLDRDLVKGIDKNLSRDDR